MVERVCNLVVYVERIILLTRGSVIGDNESEIMKMIGQLPKEASS